MDGREYEIEPSVNSLQLEDVLDHEINILDATIKEGNTDTDIDSLNDSNYENRESPQENCKNISPSVISDNDSINESPRVDAETGRTPNIDSNSSHYWSAINAVWLLIFCVLPLSITMLIPRDDVILYSTSWFETAIIYVIVFATLRSLTQGMEFTVFTGTISWISFGAFLQFYLLMIFGCFLVCIISYFVHTSYLGYNLPVPLLIVWLIIGTLGFCFIGIWTFSPAELRTKKEYHPKFLFFMLFKFYIFLTSIQNNFLQDGFNKAPNEWQWAVAIMIIVAREFNHWLLLKLVNKMEKKETEVANVLLNAMISTIYGSMVAVQLAAANIIAVGTFLFVDFLLHLRVCYQVTKLSYNVESEDNATQIMKLKKQKLQKLVLEETVEVSIVFVYAIGSAFAFYGPNQDIYRRLRSFKDFDAFNLFIVMFFMAILETFGSLICGFILKTFSGINLFYEFCDLMRDYWFIVAVRLSWTFIAYFSGYDINLGVDTDFEWLTDEGRRSMILRSQDLTNEEKSLLLKNETSF